MDQLTGKTPFAAIKPTEYQRFKETLGLIDLFPLPVVCVDVINGTIIHTNPELCTLTGFQREGLRDKKVEILFSGVNTNHLINRGMIYFLNRWEQRPLPVRVNVHFIDPNEEAAALILFPSQPSKTDETMNYNDLITSVVNIEDSCDENQACNQLANTIAKILKIEEVLIYVANSTAPSLSLIASHNPLTTFPKSLLAGDLYKLKHGQIWRPSLPANNDIHRTGRIDHYKYLASTPLHSGNSYLGLIIIGDKDNNPPGNLLETLELIGLISTRVIQTIILRNTMAQKYDHSQVDNSVLAAAIENAEEGIIFLSPDLRVEWINPSAEMIFGYADQEVRGEQAENLLVGPEGLIAALVNAAAGMPTHNMGDIAIHRRDGQAFPARLQVVPVITDQVIGIFVFVNDMTEKQQIRLRTQQLEQRAIVGELTSVFAHEVRNPINNIYSGLQLMATRLSENDPNIAVIDQMKEDFARLNRLMESLLSFSRTVQLTDNVDINLLIRRILNRWRPRLIKQNIQPFIQTDGKPTIVLGDTHALEQVFTNLISNAIDAMTPSGGTLAIHVNHLKNTPGRSQIEVSITDNGPGIPDEFKDRIFEPFITNKPRGTGLGLAITKQIVNAHKGSVSVSSFPGGTVFHVYLPAITEKVHERDDTDR